MNRHNNRPRPNSSQKRSGSAVEIIFLKKVYKKVPFPHKKGNRQKGRDRPAKKVCKELFGHIPPVQNLPLW